MPTHDESVFEAKARFERFMNDRVDEKIKDLECKRTIQDLEAGLDPRDEVILK